MSVHPLIGQNVIRVEQIGRRARRPRAVDAVEQHGHLHGATLDQIVGGVAEQAKVVDVFDEAGAVRRRTGQGVPVTDCGTQAVNQTHAPHSE